MPDEISNALHWCNTLLLVWSKTSANSYWVKLEWANALALQKNIIPFLLDETLLPSILSHKAYLKHLNINDGLTELLLALKHPTPQAVDSSSEPNSQETIREPVEALRHVTEGKAKFRRRAWVGLSLLALALLFGLTLIPLRNWLTQTYQTGRVLGDQPKASPPTTIVLMIVDLSNSLSPSQIRQVASNANSILEGMPAATKFSLYTLQPNWDRASPMESGEIGKTADERILQRDNRQKNFIKTAEEIHNRPEAWVSCIVDSLPFAQRYFKQYDPAQYKFELIFLSDMIENCSSSVLGRRVNLENDYELRDTEISKNFRGRIDLSNVNITVVLPTSTDLSVTRTLHEPRFENLEGFWKHIFSSCGFSDALLQDQDHFFFSTFLPNRFKVKS